MADSSNERVTCPDCGKGYRWQDKLVGRVVPCKQCDTKFSVPDAPGVGVAYAPEPVTNHDGTYDLDLGEDDAPATLANPAVGGKCPSCNSPVKEHAVICINCGFNMQSGVKIEKPQVSELSPGDRKESEKITKAPIRGMTWVRTGLWLNFGSIVLVIAAVPAGIAIAFTSLDFELIISILAYLALGCGMLGTLLCLAAPSEARGRPILAVSIALSLAGIVTTALVDNSTLSENFAYLADILSIAGTACFLYFFVLLSRYLNFEQITERAEKVLGLYISVQIGFYLMLVPFVGCFLVLLVLGAAFYTLWLYILLLIDLNNALSYRIGEQRV